MNTLPLQRVIKLALARAVRPLLQSPLKFSLAIIGSLIQVDLVFETVAPQGGALKLSYERRGVLAIAPLSHLYPPLSPLLLVSKLPSLTPALAD